MRTVVLTFHQAQGDVSFSSEAVARIQNTFGLKRLSAPTSRQYVQNGNELTSDLYTTVTKGRPTAKLRRSRYRDHTADKDSKDSRHEYELDFRKVVQHQIPLDYEVENRFWYWLFSFGSFLGDFPFYFTFFPFWFYNINLCVIRRVIFLWSVTMYIGQAAKEILKWPRPQSPPVVPLEPRYFKEYGMPSTHAMVGTLIPFSIFFLTMDKVQYSIPMGFTAATAWMLLVCFSRLYKGMHYILDVVVGVVLTFALMGVIFPFLDRIDDFLMTDKQAPLLLAGIITFLSLTYPSQRGFSSTREDTIVILSVTGTIYTSMWINKYFQWHPEIYECALPETILWPSLAQLGIMVLREAIGVLVTVLAYIILRPVVLETLSFIYSIDINPETRKWLSVEFPYKYVTYTLTGFACLLGSPIIFAFLGIDK